MTLIFRNSELEASVPEDLPRSRHSGGEPGTWRNLDHDADEDQDPAENTIQTEILMQHEAAQDGCGQRVQRTEKPRTFRTDVALGHRLQREAKAAADQRQIQDRPPLAHRFRQPVEIGIAMRAASEATPAAVAFLELVRSST